MIKAAIIVGIIILDRITKHIIIHALQPHQAIHVTNFFNIVHVQNKGIAFGALNNAAHSTATFSLLIAVNLIAIIILTFWMFKPGNNTWITTGISFIIGGAIGNLMDRVIYKCVIDFLDFHISQYHWPAFNIADAAVTTGTLLLGIGFLIKGTYASRSI